MTPAATSCRSTLLLWRVLLFSHWMIVSVQSRCDVSACSALGPLPDITDAYALVEVETNDASNITEEEISLFEEKFMEAYNCEIKDDFLMLLNFTLLRDTQDYYGIINDNKRDVLGLNYTTWVARYRLSRNICQDGLFEGDDMIINPGESRTRTRLLQEDEYNTGDGWAQLRSRISSSSRGDGAADVSIHPQQKNRAIKEDDVCECPPQSRSDFLIALNILLAKEVKDGRVQNYTLVGNVTDMKEIVPQGNNSIACQAENKTNTLSTSAMIDWRSDKEFLSEQDLKDICDLYIATYNNLGALNNDFCDPAFRYIRTCNVVVTSTTSSIRTSDVLERRQQRELQEGGAASVAPTEAPSSAPTRRGADLFRLVFDTGGDCFLCGSEDGLFNDVSAGQQSRKLLFSTNTSVEEFAEECWCPVGAEIRSPTIEEFIKALNETGHIDSYSELEEKECPADFTPVVGREDIDFYGEPSRLNEGILSAIGDIFTNTYVALSQEFCDSTFITFYKSSISVGLVSVGRLLLEFNASSNGGGDSSELLLNKTEGEFNQTTFSPYPSLSPTLPPSAAPTSLGADLFTLVFQLKGECSGCPGQTPLFNDNTNNRFLTSRDEDQFPFAADTMSQLPTPRRLNNNDGFSCYCKKGAILGRLSREAFNDPFNLAVTNSSDIPSDAIMRVAVPTASPTASMKPSASPSRTPLSNSLSAPSNFPSQFPSQFPSGAPSFEDNCVAESVCRTREPNGVFRYSGGTQDLNIINTGTSNLLTLSLNTNDVSVGAADCGFPDTIAVNTDPQVVYKITAAIDPKSLDVLLTRCLTDGQLVLFRVYADDCATDDQRCICLGASEQLGLCANGPAGNTASGFPSRQFQLSFTMEDKKSYFVEEYQVDFPSEYVKKCFLEATDAAKNDIFSVNQACRSDIPPVEKCQKSETVNSGRGTFFRFEDSTAKEGIHYFACLKAGYINIYSGSCLDPTCEASFLCGAGVPGFYFEFDAAIQDYWIYFETRTSDPVADACKSVTTVADPTVVLPSESVFVSFWAPAGTSTKGETSSTTGCSSIFDDDEESTFLKVSNVDNELTVGCYGENTKVEIFGTQDPQDCDFRTCVYTAEGCPNNFVAGEISFTLKDQSFDTYWIRYSSDSKNEPFPPDCPVDTSVTAAMELSTEKFDGISLNLVDSCPERTKIGFLQTITSPNAIFKCAYGDTSQIILFYLDEDAKLCNGLEPTCLALTETSCDPDEDDLQISDRTDLANIDLTGNKFYVWYGFDESNGGTPPSR